MPSELKEMGNVLHSCSGIKPPEDPSESRHESLDIVKITLAVSNSSLHAFPDDAPDMVKQRQTTLTKVCLNP